MARNVMCSVLQGILVILGLLQVVAADELPHDQSDVIVSNACFNPQTPSLSLDCPPGHMVKLLRVFYGHSPSQGCAYNADDCVLDLPPEERYPCIGRQNCDINLPQSEQGRWIPKCEQHSTYAQAHYACVPESEVRDVCQHELLTAQSGYIRSPHYPNNYPEALRCRLTIRTPFSEQKISLYIIDLNLEFKDNKCIDSLEVFDKFRDNTVCESRTKSHFFNSMGNSMRISFNSSSHGRRKGFWLYYEARPYMTTTTAAPSTEAALVEETTPEPNVTVPEVDSGSSTDGGRTTHLLHVQYTVAAFPIGVLLGVIFGVVICVLAVLLLFLVFRSRRLDPPKLPESTSTMTTTSTAAFLEDPKNNLAKCSQIAFNANNLNEGCAPCKDSKYNELDLESAKNMGKDVRVIDEPEVDWNKHSTWKDNKEIGSMC